MASNQVDRYAVFGNPIAHSKSPQIHTMFAEQTNQQLQYTAELIEIGQFQAGASAFFSENGKGANVTVPFKEDAWQFADSHTERAKRAGAVNTLILEHDGSVLGDTTDGIGLVNDISINHQIDITGKDILIIGAGGAVRGVLQPLLESSPASLVICNRTSEKAKSLANDFADMGNITGCALDAIDGRSFDIIINGTSASLHSDLPDISETIFKDGCCSYDMMYAAEPTIFMNWSEENGASLCLDGLGMLVEQAAESFYLWRGIRPETAPVLNSIRKTLNS